MILADDMPFPEKWNMNPATRMLEPISGLLQWVEGLMLQRPHSEDAWVELSKGRWEARSHGLGKDVAIRPISGDEEVPAPKQVKENKRKDEPSSPVLEKKKPAKKSCKPKGGSGIMPPDLIRRLRDGPEEGEEEISCVRANVVIQQSSESAEVDKGNLAIIPEQGKTEIISSRVEIFEEDQTVMNAVGPACHFNEAQHALNRALVLHHEAFLQIREGHEAEVRNLTKKSDSYKLLSEKLRTDLATTRDEHEEMAEKVFRILHDSEDELDITTNDPILQVDELLAEAEKFKENMDVLASKKEAVQAQLELIETQLLSAEENASVQMEKIKELQHRLDLATSDKAKAKSMVEHAKWQARREALEEVSAQGFDVAVEIENTKVEETRARRLAFPEEDSESSSESEDGENPEDAASDEDQDT
ncbi:uncharacterized protein [Nicotiana tomentosiformis]|uniref:uncharacterized protein n=1 Tax=Nicotiana tomentosiformis TaxID=4098 RepID=UPI00388C63D6